LLQFCGSVALLVQVEPHRSGVPPEQPVTHAVPLQTGIPVEQEMLQPPQLGDWDVSVSHPLPGIPSQSAHPASHEDIGKVHMPDAAHDVGPLTWGKFAQSLPQVPQLAIPEARQPPSHSRNPVGQPLPESIAIAVSSRPESTGPAPSWWAS
jgi:hypothetical protein